MHVFETEKVSIEAVILYSTHTWKNDLAVVQLDAQVLGLGVGVLLGCAALSCVRFMGVS